MSNTQIDVAFDLLVQEIDRLIDAINIEATKALNTRKYEKAKSLAEFGESTSECSKKIEQLRGELKDITNTVEMPAKHRKGRKPKRKKLSPGLLAPQKIYRVPIIKAIIELGGSARKNEVLNLVEREVEPLLTEYDYLPPNSNKKIPRWRNRAEWERYYMVKEGLLASDSQTGIWEITDIGRAWLVGEIENSPAEE